MFDIEVKIIKRNDRGEITHSEDFDTFTVPVLPRIGEKMEWCGYKDNMVQKMYNGKPYNALVMDYVEVYTVVDIVYQWEDVSDEDDDDREEEFHVMVMVERTKGKGLKDVCDYFHFFNEIPEGISKQMNE